MSSGSSGTSTVLFTGGLVDTGAFVEGAFVEGALFPLLSEAGVLLFSLLLGVLLPGVLLSLLPPPPQAVSKDNMSKSASTSVTVFFI
jgi:hypothetical protein